MQVGQWQSIGPTAIDDHGLGAVGRITTIAVDPVEPSTIYAGARVGGLWRTDNCGSTWAPIDSGLPTRRISAVAVDPGKPNRIYALNTADPVKGEKAGFYRSQTAGSSWTELSTAVTGLIQAGQIVVTPGDPNRIYCVSPLGVYASFNSGADWINSLPAVGKQVAKCVLLDPSAESGPIYAGIRHAGFFRCTDKGGKADGKSWVMVGGGLPTSATEYYDVAAALCRDMPEVIYVGVVTSTGNTRLRLYRSDDGGASFNLRYSIPATDWDSIAYLGYVGVANDNPDEVYIGGVNLLRSNDGGTTFETVNSGHLGVHVDHHAFASDPVNSGVVYTGCDGGLYRSSDRGKDGTWKQIAAGIDNVEMCDLANHPSDPYWTFAGTWDNLAIARKGSTNEWVSLGGGGNNGDKVRVVVDPSKPSTLFTVSDWGYEQDLAMSMDGGKTWKEIGGGLEDIRARYFGAGPLRNTIVSDLKHEGRVLVGGSVLYEGRPVDSGYSWQPVCSVPAENVTHWASDSSGNEYAGTDHGSVFVKAVGASWPSVPVFIHPDGIPVIDIQVDRFDDQNVYVAFLRRGPGAIFLLRHTGATPIQVQGIDIHSSFDPNRQVQCLAVDSFRSFAVYAGTDHGVYRGTATTHDSAWHWTPYGQSMPACIVTAIAVHERTGAVRISTWGSGAFEVMPDHPIGAFVSSSGYVTWLRAHRAGSGYGSGHDEIHDADVVFGLDSLPGRAFGVVLRSTDGWTGPEMMSTLRLAKKQHRRLQVRYWRSSLRNNLVSGLVME